MPFTFTDIESVDADTARTLNDNPALLAAIEAYTSSSIEPAVSARVGVIKEDFKKKMDSLDAKRRAAEELAANGGMDPDELKALREARDKNPELQATLEALKTKTAENDKALEKAHLQMQSMRLGISVNEAINDYNKAHPTTTLKSDMADLVTLLAKDALRYDDATDAFRVYNRNGDIMATDKGAATPVDWLIQQRSDRPSLFNQPTGGGAPGSNPTGSAEKVISRASFDSMTPQRQSEVARTHQITD